MSGRYRFVNIKERILRIGEESNNSISSYIDLPDLLDIPSFKILICKIGYSIRQTILEKFRT